MTKVCKKHKILKASASLALALLLVVMTGALAGCSEGQETSTAGGLVTLFPSIADPEDTGSADATTEQAGPTHPTDTEYSGISVDYTRWPGHEILSMDDFGLSRYTSPLDADGDGIDDQTDIFQSAKEYLLTKKPQYNASAWYKNGYPTEDESGVLYGVCTDVIGFGFLGAGYNLMDIVYKDIEEHPEYYKEAADTNGNGEKQIAFRRVRNLYCFFEHHAEKLTTDLTDLEAWQPGDIVIFFGKSGIWTSHIAMISDRRADDGVPYVLHHASTGQTLYEEDYLTTATKTLVGHYRYTGFNNQ